MPYQPFCCSLVQKEGLGVDMEKGDVSDVR